MIPRAGYTIRHISDSASEPMAVGDGTLMLRDSFSVHEGRETNWNVYRIVFHLTPEVLPAFKARQGDAAVREATLIWCVDYIERGLRGGQFSSGLNRVDLRPEDFQQLEQLLDEKRCRYQVLEGRDLFCAVSMDGKFGPPRTVGARSLTWTTAHECQNCSLPDQRFLCSQLSHPHIVAGLTGREPQDTRCGKNRPDVKMAGLCHAGGHECWEYLVLPREEDKPPAYVAPSLTRALDFIDTAWRLWFGKSEKLVNLPGAEITAALERDCSTEQDFDDRLIALGDVLAALLIPDSLLGCDKRDQPKGSLNRLEAVLVKIIGDDAHRARAIEAVRTLRDSNALRVGAAHGGFDARMRRVKAETSLNIEFYPDVSWREAWNQLRARVTDALSAIASALKSLQTDLQTI